MLKLDRETNLPPLCLSCWDASNDVQHGIPKSSCWLDLRSNFEFDLSRLAYIMVSTGLTQKADIWNIESNSILISSDKNTVFFTYSSMIKWAVIAKSVFWPNKVFWLQWLLESKQLTLAHIKNMFSQLLRHRHKWLAAALGLQCLTLDRYSALEMFLNQGVKWKIPTENKWKEWNCHMKIWKGLKIWLQMFFFLVRIYVWWLAVIAVDCDKHFC